MIKEFMNLNPYFFSKNLMKNHLRNILIHKRQPKLKIGLLFQLEKNPQINFL